jgi:hypothetical protein
MQMADWSNLGGGGRFNGSIIYNRSDSEHIAKAHPPEVIAHHEAYAPLAQRLSG